MHCYQGKYTVLVLAVVVLLNAAAATTATADQYVNSSEPAFLHDIGPQNQRADNPLAAGFTAIVVGLVFLRGFKTFDRHGPSQNDLSS